MNLDKGLQRSESRKGEAKAAMKRVLIIGSNGAGKTTFSYSLAKQIGLPLIHIDKLYWRGSWNVTPREEFEALVLMEAKKPRWIIEGNNISSLKQRLEYADAVFWFEFSPIICFKNVLARELKYRGKVSPDMPDQCVSRLSTGFLRDVWNFNRKNHWKIEEALAEANVRLIHVSNRHQVKQCLQRINKKC